MYAWREFERDEVIAEYEGTSLGIFNVGDEEGIGRAIGQLAAEARDKVLELERPGGKLELLDGTAAGPPYVQRANDARNLTVDKGGGRVSKRSNSAIMGTDGKLRSLRRGTRKGTAARWGPIEENGGWEELVRREILWAYGDSYWRTGAKRAEQPAKVPAARQEQPRARVETVMARLRQTRETERAERARKRGEGEGGRQEEDRDGLAGVMLAEVGNAAALTEARRGQRVMCLFVTEIYTRSNGRRAGTARQMLAHAVEKSGATEVHAIVRAGAEQQEGMRQLCGKVGMRRAEAGGDTAYEPRQGDTATSEEYWYGDARDVVAAAAEGHGVKVEWHTGGGGALLPKEHRKAIRKGLRTMHEGRGGSHEGRTWDEREVIPRKAGCCVVATRGASGAEDARDAAEQREEEVWPGEAEETHMEMEVGWTEEEERYEQEMEREFEMERAGAMAQERGGMGEGMEGLEEEARDEQGGGAAEVGEHTARAVSFLEALMPQLQGGASGTASGETGGGEASDATGGQEREEGSERDLGGMLTADRGAQYISVLNVGGVHMVRRAGQRWGDGLDMYARPGGKMVKAFEDARGDGAVILVWTETHVAGDERQAMRGYLKRRGWDSVGTDGYVTAAGRIRGGVMVAWNTDVAKRERAKAGEEEGAPTIYMDPGVETEEGVHITGRLVSAKLVMLACGSRVHVVGAYAPGRGGDASEAKANGKEAERKAAEAFWSRLHGMRTQTTVVIAGDLNAELPDSLARNGRTATEQDRRLATLVGQTMTQISAGVNTWARTMGGGSEIDHVIVHPQQRHLWGRAEVRPGVLAHDHGVLRVRLVGVPQGEEDVGPKRPVGEDWGKVSEKGWKAYGAALQQWHQAHPVGKDPREELCRLQDATKEAAGEQAGGRAETSAEEAEEGGAESTREEHVERIGRWQRLAEAAAAWSGRGGLNSMGADGRWMAAQQTGQEFERDAASMGRSARREVLLAICEERRDEAVEAATRVEAWHEEDEVMKRMECAIECDTQAGGAYVMLWDLLNTARGRGRGGGAKLTALYENDDKENGREIHGSGQVREHSRELGERINKGRHAAMNVVRAIMATSARAGKRDRDENWVDKTCTWERFQKGLERTEARKGVGCDGWNAYLMRKAPTAIQKRYFTAIKEAIRQQKFPAAWRERIAMLFMKPGEDPCELGRRRDIWLECHGLKLTMWMLGEEYERAAEGSIPMSQAGGVKDRGCPEQTLVMRCQKEQCAVEQTMCCRGYLDMGVFFMSCVREVQWEAERWCGVRPEVTKVVQALYAGATGRYETAYGLTETFPMENGNTQGCSQSPTRSKMQLRMIQEAVSKLCTGYRFRGAESNVTQLWFCDDGAFMTKDLHTLQLVFDTCWMVTRASGMQIQIKKDKKTAWQASYWANGVEHEVTDWEMRLPDGRSVPRVEKAYTYLGSAEPAVWEDAQEGVRKQVVRTCSQLLRLIGRTGGLGERQTRVAMGLAIEGTIGFYGRSTAIGWEACEEIERVRAEVLRQRGFASGEVKVQMHASRAAGGLDHRHVYQHAAAVLVDEIERALAAPVNAPAHVAVEAHLRATCVRLGWDGYGDMREWWPAHLEHTLSEDMIGEAWLLARLRTGIREEGTRVSGRPWEEGPPIWEEDGRREWRASETGPCRVRVGLARAGGVAARVQVAGGGCEYTMRSRRVAAAGIRAWADITHSSGRWMTWAELQRKHGSLRESDRVEYESILGELEGARWDGVRGRWWEVVATEEWKGWETARDEAMDGTDAKEGRVKRILAARQTAPSLGRWELLVEWQGPWSRGWVAETQLRSGGRGLTAAQRGRVDRLKEEPVPHSLHDRLTHQAGGSTQWREAEVGGVRISARMVETAIGGELSEKRVCDALLQMWKVFEKHAQQVAGGGAGGGNLDEQPTRRRAVRRGAERTLYEGREGQQRGERRRASLAAEGDRPEQTMQATAGHVHERVQLQRRLEAMDDERRVVPATHVQAHMMWSTDDPDRVWRRETGAGYEAMEDEDRMGDAVMRLMMRSRTFEVATGHGTRTPDGTEVTLDAQEREVLNGGQAAAAERANAKVSKVAVGLHMVHHFTDAWATDGSKGRVWSDGAWQVRVACGAYGGVVAAERQFGESTEDHERRRVGGGMRGMRLPACYEVVDAELHAILMVLQDTAAQEGASGRRVLVMSDSLTALRMVEDAWRGGVRWDGPRTGRAAILHAINAAREQVERVVMMWTPAHAGVAPNAYADAVAKAYLGGAVQHARARRMVSDALPAGKVIHTIRVEGEMAHWPETRFTAVREAAGWWVRRRERRQATDATAVDPGRIGEAWQQRVTRCWEDVWEQTGARTAATAQAEGAEGEGDGDSSGTLLEAAEAAAEGGTGKPGKRKDKRKQATGIEMRDDAGRCGVVMAARAGALWGAGTKGRQGCPACCSRETGWRWTQADGGTWVWRSGSGEEPVEATLMHVLCGGCHGTDEAARSEGREQVKGGLQRARRALTRRGKGGTYAVTHGRQRVVAMVAAAQRALAKGERATEEEQEAMRSWIAGCLPPVSGEHQAWMKHVTRQVAEAVRHTQWGATRLREAWKEAGKKEVARRATREGGREGNLWRGVGWDTWRRSARSMAVAEESGSAPEGGAQRNGWTMASALIMYKKRQLAQSQKRQRGKGKDRKAVIDRGGDGVVLFDVETTELITDEVPVEDMRVAVACAVRAATRDTGEMETAQAETLTCWHEQVTHAPGGGERHGVETLLRWMDAAAVIVAYNGRAFDMEVLRGYYRGDTERWARHEAKLHDPLEAVRRAAGHRVKLSTLLSLNRMGGKAGTGCDAPRWWKEGRWEQLERYCMRDVHALMELVGRNEIRVGTHTVTREAGVAAALRPHSAAGGAEVAGVMESDTADARPGATPATTRKRRRPEGGYDEIARRVRRRIGEIRYVERRGYTGAKRTAIVMGAAAMERVVRGRYEWRDAKERPIGRYESKRKKYWADEERRVTRRGDG